MKKLKNLETIRDELAGDFGYGSYELYVSEIIRSGCSYSTGCLTSFNDEVSTRFANQYIDDVFKMKDMLLRCNNWISNCNQYANILKDIDDVIS